LRKLKQSELAEFRTQLWEAQGKRCALSGEPLLLSDAVVDHNHTTGEVRGVLSRGANSMLGKIENHMRIAKLNTPAKLAKFLAGVVPYIYNHAKHDVMYPTHKTPDEKRIARNTKARKARAAKRVAE